MLRRIAIILISVLVSGGLLALVLRGVPLAEVYTALIAADPFWSLIAVLLVFLALLTRAERWRGLLGNRIPLGESFWIMGITLLLNQLPLRAGEVARSLLATRRDVPLATAATSIVIERLLDTLLVVLMVAWSVTQIPAVSAEMTRGAALFGIAGVIGFAVLLVFAHRPRWARGLLAFTLRLIPPLKRLPLSALLDQVLDGLHPLTRWHMLAHAIIWTLIAWAVSLTTLYASVRALDIEQSTLVLTVLGVALSSLSIAIPVTVASLGLIEGAIKVTGNLLGVADIASTALGFLFHGLTVLGYVLAGVPGLWLMGISLDEVLRQDEARENEGDPSQTAP